MTYVTLSAGCFEARNCWPGLRFLQAEMLAAPETLDTKKVWVGWGFKFSA